MAEPPSTEIERTRSPSGAAAEIAARFLDPGVPVILEGAAAHFPAVRRFSRAYLEDKIGKVEIAWKLSSSHKHPDFCAETIPAMFARGTGTVAELLAAITTGPREERSRRLFTGDERFLVRRRDGVTSVDPDLAPLLDDVEVPALVPADRLYTAWAWLSGPGVRTWLHYDNNGCHNLNVQLTGEKECELFAPDDLRRIYPFLLGGGNPATNCSRVDVEAPDPVRFPELAGARRWRGTLRAGDVLFIPAWWSHTFRHVGDLNSNVNFWWRPARPTASVTAHRQALLDAATRAGIAPAPGSAEAALLERLDAAAVARETA
jgi:lysine-specific demethylase 8